MADIYIVYFFFAYGWQLLNATIYGSCNRIVYTSQYATYHRLDTVHGPPQMKAKTTHQRLRKCFKDILRLLVVAICCLLPYLA